MNATPLITRIVVALALGLIGSTARAQDSAPAESGSSTTTAAEGQAKQPNILVIWGDDIGIWNISFNSKG